MSGNADGGQSSHQLDFYQAMADFKLMFPNMDEEIIEAVLRANGGAVDGTIDQLLTMNTDFDQPAVSGAIAAGAQPPFSAKLKRIVELSGRGRLTTSEASSSSYDDDTGSNFSQSSFGKHGPSKSSVKSSLGSESGPQYPKRSESCGVSSISTNMSEDLLLLDTTTDDSHVFSNLVDVHDGACGGDGCTPLHQLWDDDGFLPPTPAPPIPPRSPLLVAPPLPPKMSLLGAAATSPGRSNNGSQIALEPKKMARHWDPPMLGKLPDDFLRLEISPSAQRTFKTSPGSVHRGMTHSLHDATRSRNPGQDCSSHPGTRVRHMRLNSETGQARSHSSAGHSHRSSHDGVISMAHSCDCQHHLSCGHERLVNSKRHHVEIDANTWQMLEDERLALVLQSEEFLAELRQNEDFMRSLEHERKLQNLGDNNAGLLPGLDKSAHTEDSAEFRTLLKHIGDSSKKKLAAAAQKFFAKCKKKKQVLKDTAAPSTINLLDDDEAENKDLVDENIQFTDEQYKWWTQH